VRYAEFYESFVQHPLLLWGAALVGLVVALSRPGLSGTVRAYCVALAAISLFDAWLTSDQVVGIGTLSGAAASFVPLTFVLVGDFRYFLFVESAKPNGTLCTSPDSVVKAFAWTLLVPLASQIVVLAMGSNEPRILFLIYEILFVMVSIGISRVYLPQRSGALQWTRRVTRFVIAYYALWAAADALILTIGADAAFLLRVLPNVLYYGGLVPAIAWTAPKP
jgi:hypothetical protein